MPYDSGNYQDKWRLERLAQRVRSQLGLGPTDLLDVWRLADAVFAHVFFPADLVEPVLAERVTHVNWDGFAFQFDREEHLMVLLNPARPERRQRATLLEELAHHILRHPPSKIYKDPLTGLRRRVYNRSQEQEAYELGAMLLLPKEIIQQHVKVVQGRAEELADRHRCSAELVEFRIKRCRLWPRYQTYME
jgi:Zn-dependent peptidase ImmA (M78 family)